MRIQGYKVYIWGFRVEGDIGFIGVYRGHWGYIGEYIGIMERKMETTIWGLGFRVRIKGLGFTAWGSGKFRKCALRRLRSF